MTTTIQNQTLWQIGKPGGRGKEFVKAGGWQAEFTYTVGSDADSINQPHMPPVLVVPERKQKPNLYSTNKLNIRFTLEREYRKDELKLFYDFFGSEKDTLLVNGQKLTEILGAGEGKLKKNQIPLPALGKGEHTLTFTTTGGGPDKLHWIDYLKLEEKATVTQAPIEEGPAGSDIQGTDFQILPQQDAPQSRIKRLMLRCACAIDALQVEYENLATQPPQIYQSQSYGGNGGGYAEFRIYSGDYLTKISGTWGKQSPKDPYEDIVSLQFHTSQGASSRIFGGENPNKEVESFEFTAPEGYEIIGFFGSVGSRNILARLGVYLQAIESSNEPVEVSTKPVTINPQPVEVSTKPLPINPQPGEVSTKPLYVNPQPVLSFDGIEDYIQVNYQPALNSAQFTISFWAKVTGGQGAYRCPIASRMDNPGLSGYLIYATPDNNWQFWIGNGGSSWVTLVGTQIELNTWTHIGATYDGSAMHFYINGTEVGNPVTTNFVPNTNCPLFIGAGDTQANPNYFFPGELSQVSLWNVALSVSQIQATMSAQLQGNETGLVGYWSLTQSSGSIAYDHASGQCHGNIIGAANWVTAPDLVVAGAGGSGATSTQTQNQTQILWQIGKPGGRGKEFVKAGGWQPEFTYIVGSDADSINRPHMPPVLVVPERKQKPNLYSTNKLNIRFTLERNYGNGELTLFYDFFGSEKDTILINGQKLTEILGAGEAKLKQNQIPLPALGKGEHTLTFTTAGGGPDKLHWIDYLKLEALSTVTQAMMQLGPAGSDIQGTDFEIKPRQDAPQSRIKRLMLRCNSAIDALQVEYENLATQPPSLYQSIKAGGNGGTYKEWSINSGEYLTKISGTWGSQGGANDPYEDIISLQFHTQKGTSSPIFGGEYPLKKVEPFEFVAPEGYEIIGFFGAVGSRNILVRLGVYLRPIVAITQPGEAVTKPQYVNPQPVLSFDGIQDYIQVNYQPALNPAQFTISLWAKVTGGQGTYRCVIASRMDNPGLSGYLIYATPDNNWQFWIGNGGSSWVTLVGTQVELNTWTHIGATYDGSAMHFYINGTEVGNPVTTNFVPNTTYPLFIGAGDTQANPNYFFGGELSQVSLWNVAYTAAQIQATMSAQLQGNEAGLVAYWSLTQSSGSIAYDHANGQNHGTIIGEANWETAPDLTDCTGGSGATSTQSEIETLWQIGKPGNRADEFPTGKGFVQEFTYTIGSDADSINHPNMPPVLVIPGSVPNPKRYSTCKLNISFNLERDYGKDELTLLYDFFGSETDTILIDGQNLIQIKGTGEGKIKKNQIPLPALVKGNHILTFTTAGGTRKGAWKDAHLIDYLKLQVATTSGMVAQPTPTPSSQGVQPVGASNKPIDTIATSETLWQIGKPGGDGKEFVGTGGWQAEFTYTVGSDADSINQAHMPPVLVSGERKQKPGLYSTDKLNISFTLERDYGIGELTLFYNFFGSETDTIFINGQKLIEIEGVGEGKLKQNQIPLPALASGNHTLTFTTSGGASDRAHWIDYLKLEGVVKAQTLWQIGKPGNRADEFPTGKGFVQEFTYTIGSDADSINHPNMPPVLVTTGSVPNPKRYSTCKLNISFNLERDYGKDELTLLYDFFGSETDTILIDGQNLIQIKGSGEGKLKKNQIPLPALVKGNHILTFTTAGGTRKGAWKDAHLIDYLKLEAASSVTQAMMTQGPVGSDVQGTDFEIKPREDAPQSRIKRLMLRCAGAIDSLQVEYENLATQPPSLYQSLKAGGNGGAYKEWSINNGDYLTKISGTCGSRGPSYPNLNIVSLQFHTHKGLTSQIFGGENPRKQVEPFEFVAPEGYQIIGFFGASDTGILVRLGVYLQPIVPITQPGEGADSLLNTGSQG
ncbi:MAG: LamG-like jellyroll fold domain-containing protein, partial [Rivularia sp. (in: cyanobacteria)]